MSDPGPQIRPSHALISVTLDEKMTELPGGSVNNIRLMSPTGDGSSITLSYPVSLTGPKLWALLAILQSTIRKDLLVDLENLLAEVKSGEGPT